MDVYQIIQYVLLGIIVLMFLFPILWGLMRGWKKGLFRFVWVFLTFLILLFTSFYLAKFVMNFDLTKLGISLNGHNSLNDLCISYMESNAQIKELMSYSPSFANLVAILPLLLATVILCVALYWLLKWLLWPIWAILSRLLLKPYTIRYDEGKKIKTKKKKGRWFGALTGVALGYLTCMVTMIPIVGISQFANTLDEKYKTSSGQGIVTETLNEMVDGGSQYLSVYQSSAAQKVMKYTGMEALSNLLFQELTTSQDEYRISLTDEADQFVGIYADVKVLQSYDFENLSNDDLDQLFVLSRRMIDSIFDSHIVTRLVDEIVPSLITSMVEGSSSIIKLPTLEQPIFNEAMLESIKTLEDMNAENLKHELLATIDVLEVFHEEGLLLDFLQNPNTINYETMLASVSPEFGEKLSNAFFSLNHAVSITPILLNAFVEYGCQQWGAVFEESQIQVDRVKDVVAGLIDTAVLVMQEYQENENYYFSKATLYQTADLIDDLFHSTIISESTKQSILEKTKEKVVDLYQQSELPTQLETVVNDFMNATIALDEFADELKIFADVYHVVWDSTGGKFSSETFNSMALKDLGKWLDVLTRSEIYNYTFTSLCENGIDFLLTYIPEDMEALQQPVKDLVNNLKQVQEKAKAENVYDEQNIGVWEQELDKLQIFYNQMVAILPELENIDTAITETDLLDCLGIGFDDVLSRSSMILKKEDIHDLFTTIMDYVSLPEDIEKISIDGKTITEQLKENIVQIDGVSHTWTHEMSILKYLLTADFTIQGAYGTYNLEPLGKTLDSLKTSTLFGNMVNAIIEYFIDEMQDGYVPADQLPATGMDAVILDVMEGMKNNLDQVTSYQTEMVAISKVLNQIDSLDFEMAGTLLDELASTKLLGNQIVKIMNYYVEEYTSSLPSTYAKVVELLKENISTLKAGDYSTEIDYIITVSDLLAKDSFTKEELDTMIESLLDTEGNSKSKIITNAVIQEMVSATFDTLVATTLGDFGNNTQLLEVLKNNITQVDNVETLLSAVDTLQNVVTELQGNVSSVQDITNNADQIISSIETLYSNDVVGDEATKLMTDVTLNLMESTVQNDASIPTEVKETITNEIAVQKTQLAKATTLEEYQNVLSSVMDQLQNWNSNI